MRSQPRIARREQRAAALEQAFDSAGKRRKFPAERLARRGLQLARHAAVPAAKAAPKVAHDEFRLVVDGLEIRLGLERRRRTHRGEDLVERLARIYPCQRLVTQ